MSGYTSILGLGDFDEDGIDDVILNEQIRFGTADGTFRPGPALPISIPFGSGVNGVAADLAVGDFDGDHHLDLAIRPRTGSATYPWVYALLTIYSGDGKGNFHATRQVPNRQFDYWFMPISAADLDGDGIDDLIIHGPVIEVVLSPGTERQPVLVGAQILSVTLGDFNGDSRPDLAAVSWDNDISELRVFLNDGHGGMRLAWKTHLQDTEMYARDVDGDGKDDLVLGPFYPPGDFIIENQSMAAVLHSNGDGSFSGLPVIDAPQSSGGVQGDFDGNGADDVMLSSYVRISNVQIDYKTLSTSTSFSPAATMVYQSAGALFKPIAGDFDGDGIGDVAFTEGYQGVNPGTNVLFGDRAGHYRQSNLGDVSLAAVTDLDGDGADDILTADASTISLLFGGLTPFARRKSYASTGATTGLFALRPHPGGVPQLFVPSDYPGGLLFNPTCEKSRAVRH